MFETAATFASAGAIGEIATRNLARIEWGLPVSKLLLLANSHENLVEKPSDMTSFHMMACGDAGIRGVLQS